LFIEELPDKRVSILSMRKKKYQHLTVDKPEMDLVSVLAGLHSKEITLREVLDEAAEKVRIVLAQTSLRYLKQVIVEDSPQIVIHCFILD